METRQLYRYLYSHSSLSPEEVKATPQFFERNMRDHHNFSFPDEFYIKKFKQLNDHYRYLLSNDEQSKLFQCLYTVFTIADLDIYGEDRRAKLAYNAIVYFNVDNNAETILKTLDQYCHENKLYYTSVLSKSLKSLTAPIPLETWQRFLVSNHSPDALRYFDIASEMKAFVPSSLSDAKQWLEDLLSKKELDHESLWRIYGDLLGHYTNISDQRFNAAMQVTFFMALSRNNFRQFVDQPATWYQVFEVVIQPDMQKELLGRLDAETLSTMFSNLSHFRHILGFIDSDVVSFLLEKINMDVLLKDVEDARDLAHFIRNYLSCRDPFIILSKDIGYQRLQKYILTAKHLLEFRWMLDFGKEKEFVLNYLDALGKEKSVLLIKSAIAPALSAILQCVKREDRFTFIKMTLTPDDLLTMRKNQGVWKALKLTLNPSQRALLDEYVYSKEELTAKFTLKNIKQTILNTEWSFWRYETPVTVEMKEQKKQDFVKKQVPRSIQSQLNEMKAVSERKKTHSEAVKSIYLLGKAEKEGWIATAGNKLFQKGATERYFERFESQASFDRAFVVRKGYK